MFVYVHRIHRCLDCRQGCGLLQGVESAFSPPYQAHGHQRPQAKSRIWPVHRRCAASAYGHHRILQGVPGKRAWSSVILRCFCPRIWRSLSLPPAHSILPSSLDLHTQRCTSLLLAGAASLRYSVDSLRYSVQCCSLYLGNLNMITLCILQLGASKSDVYKSTYLQPAAQDQVNVKAEKLGGTSCPTCGCTLEMFQGNEGYCRFCQTGLCCQRASPCYYLLFLLLRTILALLLHVLA